MEIFKYLKDKIKEKYIEIRIDESIVNVLTYGVIGYMLRNDIKFKSYDILVYLPVEFFTLYIDNHDYLNVAYKLFGVKDEFLAIVEKNLLKIMLKSLIDFTIYKNKKEVIQGNLILIGSSSAVSSLINNIRNKFK